MLRLLFCMFVDKRFVSAEMPAIDKKFFTYLLLSSS